MIELLLLYLLKRDGYFWTGSNWMAFNSSYPSYHEVETRIAQLREALFHD